jgi:hypothetical protein
LKKTSDAYELDSPVASKWIITQDFNDYRKPLGCLRCQRHISKMKLE